MKPNDSKSKEAFQFQLGKNSGTSLNHSILNADISQIYDLLMLRLAGELKEHDKRVSCLEKNQQEVLQRIECLEAIIPDIRHIELRNEELENQRSFYCPPD